MISRPDTPLPWINYLGCEEYFGIISNTAGGYSFYRDARLRRLTRYRYNNVPFDSGGRYIYLRDKPTAPSGPLHGSRPGTTSKATPAGTAWDTASSGPHIVASRRRPSTFVPLGENLEIWRLRITNLRRKPARLSVFSCIEFCLWDAQDDATNFQRNFSTGEVEIDNGVIYHKTEYRERRNHFAYFACSANRRVRHTTRYLSRSVPRLGSAGCR